MTPLASVCVGRKEGILISHLHARSLYKRHRQRHERLCTTATINVFSRGATRRTRAGRSCHWQFASCSLPRPTSAFIVTVLECIDASNEQSHGSKGFGAPAWSCEALKLGADTLESQRKSQCGTPQYYTRDQDPRYSRALDVNQTSLNFVVSNFSTLCSG